MDISFKCSFFFWFFQLEKTHQQVLSHCLHPRACVFKQVFSQMTLHSRYATRLNKYTVLRCRLSQKWLFSIPRSVLQLREMDFISVFQRLCLSKKVFFLMLIIYMRQRQIILSVLRKSKLSLSMQRRPGSLFSVASPATIDLDHSFSFQFLESWHFIL